MKKGLATLVAAIAIGSPAAGADVRQADAPLVVNGDISLTTRDFEAYVQRVPENRRDEFRASMERVRNTVDGLWLQRMLAHKARLAGLDQDPTVQSRQKQAQESVLADAFMANVDRNVEFPKNLEARAQELYKANAADYTTPEQVHVQHILVGPTWRTEEMALARAREIHAQAVAGKEDFKSLAVRYSDDPSVKKNEGDLGMAAPQTYTPDFAAAVAKMKTPGELSEPVRTPFGYHIIRFVDRKPGKLQPYESVKRSIIAAERQKFIDAARQSAQGAVRNDPNNHVYLENVDALKTELDLSKIKPMSQAEAAKR
jgi:peptidyl-prolyl cis-trans isomerase C